MAESIPVPRAVERLRNGTVRNGTERERIHLGPNQGPGLNVLVGLAAGFPMKFER